MTEIIYPIAGFHLSLLLALMSLAFRSSERGHAFGIRSRYTLASDENWRRVHDRAARPTLALAWVGMAVSIAAMGVPWLRGSETFAAVLGVQTASLIRFAMISE